MTYVGPRPLAAIGRVVAWVLVLGVAAAGARFAYGRYKASKAAGAAPQYYTVAASTGAVTLTADGAGTFQPASTENVAPKVGGTVTSVAVTVGQKVAAGAVLFDLADTGGLAQQVASAQASLDQSQRQLEQLENPGVGQDPRTIQKDQLMVQQAQVSLKSAQLTLAQDEATAAADAVATTPIAGTVESVGVTAGQQVGTGTALLTVQPSGAPTVTVDVPEEDLPFLPDGAAAAVSIPATRTTAAGTVSARAASTSGSVPTGAGGGSAAGASQALIPLTVTLSSAVSGVPAGAAVTVDFTPQGDAPATYSWSDAGTITYPAAVTVRTPQAGTVSGLPAVGATLSAGQQVASVTPGSGQSQAESTVSRDQNSVQQDQVALQQAQLTLSQAQHPTPSSPQAVAAAQSAVDSAQQALALRQQALTDLTVRAPVAGIVQSIAVQTGQTVGAGTQALTLQSAGALTATVDIDELDVHNVKPGQTATITVGAFPNQQFTGTVQSIAPTAQSQFGVAVYPVTLVLTNPPANLRAGMTISASIVIQTVQNALRVPGWAVTSLGSGQGMVQVMQNGKPVPVRVQTGLSTARWTQILSGLKPGQQVVAGDASAANANSGRFFRGGFGGPPPGRGGGGARGG